VKTTINIQASIRQRLLNLARLDKRPFNELLQYYAMERFLYRLSRSKHADSFILKGALMLRVWRSPKLRPTMDIDMLGKMKNVEADIVALIREIMNVEVEDDGLRFDPDSIRAEQIMEETEYEGARIRFRGKLDTARVIIQVDIGFGDIVYPGPEESELPTMLDFPAPRLLCYSRESSIAEKFETMARLGGLNSRMKDFYDIWLLTRQFDFNGAIMAEAIRLTLERRGTSLPSDIEAFSKAFLNTKQVQWAAFRKRLQQDHIPVSFQDIVSGVKDFIAPLLSEPSKGRLKNMHWTAPGPWK
jgi:hypothetical protein